jgi:uncharacterized protein (UPF0276 family)
MAVLLDRLPYLGLGISAEFDSCRKGIDAVSLREERPDLVQFLEYGGDLDRGLDEHVRRWAARGWPATYHFLDVNLDEREDVDDEWLTGTAALAREIGAAWLCGDAGQWHFGPRGRGQQILLPPVLSRACADEMGDNIAHLQEVTGFACLPENPPSAVYLGDMHLLDFYARVCERAGSGMLLDVAHLAIFQRMRGHAPTSGLDGFPLERVVEVHVAGGVVRDCDGFSWVDDTHAPEPLPDTWEILDRVVPHATGLRALVYECERNSVPEVLPVFERLRARMPAAPAARREGLEALP